MDATTSNKVCRHCGRVGTRNFFWTGEFYECQFDMPCRRRRPAHQRRLAEMAQR